MRWQQWARRFASKRDPRGFLLGVAGVILVVAGLVQSASRNTVAVTLIGFGVGMFGLGVRLGIMEGPLDFGLTGFKTVLSEVKARGAAFTDLNKALEEVASRVTPQSPIVRIRAMRGFEEVARLDVQ